MLNKGMGSQFCIKIAKVLISVRCDSQELLKALLDYLRDHLVDSEVFDAEIDLKLKKVLSPIPTYARLALRYYRLKVFYLKGWKYFTDFRSYLMIEPEGKRVEGFISKETLEESGIAFFIQTFFTLCLYEVLRHFGVFFLHSAGLVSPRLNQGNEETCYLFPASGGEGKTTLSIYLIRQGYRYLNDDTVFLSWDGGELVVSGFKKLSRISEEVISRFPELRGLKSVQGLKEKGERIVNLDQFYPGQRVEQSKGRYVIIFPKKVLERESRLERISAQEGFSLLLAQNPFAFIDPNLAQSHLKIFRDLLNSAELWRILSGRDWFEAPARLRELVEGAGKGEGR